VILPLRVPGFRPGDRTSDGWIREELVSAPAGYRPGASPAVTPNASHLRLIYCRFDNMVYLNCLMRNKTLQKGLLILEALAAEARDFSLAQVAAMAALDKSQTCRLLQTLAAMGYVVRDPRSRRYRIGLRTLELSASILSRMELHRAGITYLHQLSDRVEATSYLGVPHLGQVLIVATVYPSGVYRDGVPGFGSVMPLDHSAMGKVLLAHMPPKEAGETGQQLARQLARVRAENVAVIIKGSILAESVVGVAAPVRNHEGRVVAALGASLRLHTWKDTDQASFQAAVLAAANGLSFALGYAASQIAR